MASFSLLLLFFVASANAQVCDPLIANPFIRVLPANTGTCTPGQLHFYGDVYSTKFVDLVNVTGSAVFSGDVNVTGRVLSAPRTTGHFDSIYFGVGAKGLAFEGATDDGNEMTITAADPTTGRSVVFPDASGTLPLIQPVATDTLDLSVGTATRTDVFAVGTNLRVDGAATGSSTVSRAFLFGDGSYISALEPGHTISDAVVVGPSNDVQAIEWPYGVLGALTHPVIIGEQCSIYHSSSAGTMQNPGIFGGWSNDIIHEGVNGTTTSNYNSMFGGAGNVIQTLNAPGNMDLNTIVGGSAHRILLSSYGWVQYNLLAGGQLNTISSTATGSIFYSAIIGGNFNGILAEGPGSRSGFIATSFNSKIYLGVNAAIIGGKSHQIGSTASASMAVIIGGQSHQIGSNASASMAVIIGGRSNKADHRGAVVMGNGGKSDAIYSLSVNGGIYMSGSLVSTSDERIKANIGDLGNTHALDLIMQLQPRNYTYHTAYAHLKSVSNETYQAGFIAQEVEAVIPGAVTTGDNELTYHSEEQISAVYNDATGEVITPAYYPANDVSLTIENKKSLEYMRLIPYTVAAIQQLKTNADTGAFTTLSASTSLSLSDGVDMDVGTATGTKMGTSAAQKLAFYGASPVSQDSTTGSTASYTIIAGNTFTDASCSTGGTGTACLTVEDLVRIIKNLGFAAV